MNRGNPSGAQGGPKGHPYQQWPKGTRWAYFKNLPKNEENSRSKGWVRVGSQLWKDIQAYNNGTHRAVGPGGGHGGHGTQTVPNDKYIPSGRHTGQWNPASPQGKLELTHAKVTPTQTGTNTTPGQNQNANPPKTPPKGPKGPDYSKYIGNPNTQKMIPLADAAAQAGLQYDAQIHDTKVQQADQIAQAAQNLADIKHWYTHIQALNTAAQQGNDQAVAQETGANQADMMAGLAAIGGSSNAHAGQALAQGLQANTFARQMGTNADNYYANQATALAQNQTDQTAAQTALDSQTSQSLDSQLHDLLGQRGQALTTDQMALIAANNAARQGNFGNRISKAQDIAGLLQLGLNAKMTQTQLNMAGGTGKHGFIPFSSQTPAQQQATLSLLLQGGKDAQGHSIAVPLVLAQARAKAMHYDAATGSNLWSILRTYTQ